MPSVRIDGGLHREHRDDPNLPALGLHLLATSYSFDEETDGFIPTGWVVGHNALELVEALVHRGLWAPSEGGFKLAGFTSLNGTAEARENRRAAARARMRKNRGLQNKGTAKPTTSGKSRSDVRANTPEDEYVRANMQDGSTSVPRIPVNKGNEGVGVRANRSEPTSLAEVQKAPPPEPSVSKETGSDVRANMQKQADVRANTPEVEKHPPPEPIESGESDPDVRANTHFRRIKGLEVGVQIKNEDEGDQEAGGSSSTLKAEKEKTTGEREAERICRLMAEFVARNTGTAELPPKWCSTRWLDAARLLLDAGPPGYTNSPASVEQVEYVIEWLDRAGSRNAAFWSSNVHSMPKLREQWHRLATAIREEKTKRPKSGSAARQQDRQQRRLEALRDTKGLTG